jgi:hypothetical protein
MRWTILLVIGGVVLIWVAYREWDLGSTATEAPEEMTLKALIERGPEGNPNIELTRFALAENIIYSTRGSSWQQVWVPIVPEDEVDPKLDKVVTQNIRAILTSTNVRNQDQLEERLNQHRLPVLVTNKITALTGKQRQLLEEAYLETDFSTCLILQEGRTPYPLWGLLLMGGLGAGLVGVGGFLVARDFWRWRSRARYSAT